ncbi:MAG: hypothetical protein HZB54_06900 [Deltaproteobacteria bacterium]|nr:hypothetical protein [Deltaproteobacteria bacterium]
MILPGADIRNTGEYAEIIRKKIGNNIFVKDAVGPKEKALNIKGVITCSAGVASLKENVRPNKKITKMGTAIISQADKAMYKAKDQGKNRIFFAKGKV